MHGFLTLWKNPGGLIRIGPEATHWGRPYTRSLAVQLIHGTHLVGEGLDRRLSKDELQALLDTAHNAGYIPAHGRINEDGTVRRLHNLTIADLDAIREHS